MIELTTGIMFLMTSMYGAGSASSVDAVNVQPSTASLTENRAYVSVSTDRKAIEKYLREKYADTPILIEIARCESEFRQFDKNGDPIRGIVNKADVGVMQINEKYHLESSNKLGYDIHTIEGNVAYAKHLYEESGSKPWSASQPCWGSSVVAMNR